MSRPLCVNGDIGRKPRDHHSLIKRQRNITLESDPTIICVLFVTSFFPFSPRRKQLRVTCHMKLCLILDSPAVLGSITEKNRVLVYLLQNLQIVVSANFQKGIGSGTQLVDFSNWQSNEPACRENVLCQLARIRRIAGPNLNRVLMANVVRLLENDKTAIL